MRNFKNSLGIMLIGSAVLLGSITTAYSASFYVKNTGNDNASGLNDANAWKTINKVNQYNFSSGDIINLKRSDIFDDAPLKLEGIYGSGKSITVQAYGSGARPHLDGDSIRPINIRNDSRAIEMLTLKDLDVSGQDWTSLHAYNGHIENINNITLDGIHGNGAGGSSTGNVSNQEGKNPFYLRGGDGHIEIKNCKLYNWGPADMPINGIGEAVDGIGEVYGFEIDSKKYGTFSVHHNIVYNMNADAIQVRVFTGTSGEIFSNEFYNCGENAVDIKGSSNMEVHNNNFYRQPGFTGHGGIGGKGTPLISIIPTTEAGGGGSNNNVIRDNYLHDNPDNAVYIGYKVASYQCNNNVIHSNFAENTRGIHLGSGAAGVKVYNNIISNFNSYAVYENNSNPGTEIYNNTFYSKKTKYGIQLNTTNEPVIIHNVVYIENQDTNSHGLEIETDKGQAQIKCNNWYNTSSDSRTSYNGSKYRTSNISSWRDRTHAGENFSPVQFKSPVNGDFELSETLYCENTLVGVYAPKSPDSSSAIKPPKGLTIIKGN